jgi:SNF2 family DNA or RNA helicase
LDDFGALLSFLRVYPFDSQSSFNFHIATPIKKGGNEGIDALRKLVNSVSLRRTKVALSHELNLQPRSSEIHLVELDKGERTLYDFLKKHAVEILDSTTERPGEVGSVFKAIMKLRRICNHGLGLLTPAVLQKLENRHIDTDEISAIFQEPEPCENCGSKTSQALLNCCHLICKRCMLRAQETSVVMDACPLCPGTTSALMNEPSPKILEEEAIDIDDEYQPSSKIRELLQSLHAEQAESSSRPVKR